MHETMMMMPVTSDGDGGHSSTQYASNRREAKGCRRSNGDDLTIDEKKSESSSQINGYPNKNDSRSNDILSLFATTRDGESDFDSFANRTSPTASPLENTLGSTLFSQAIPPQLDQPLASSSSNSHGNSGNNNGLHHRHHHHSNHASGHGTSNQSPRNSKRHLPHLSPRQRKTERRKRKWTIVHIVRILLLCGVLLYLVMIVRVMYQSASAQGSTDTLRGRLSNLLHAPVPDLYSDGHIPSDGEPGYLRSKSVPLPFLGRNFIRKKSSEGLPTLQRRLAKQVSDRRVRTRPPNTIQAEHIESYQILTPDKYERQPAQTGIVISGRDVSASLADTSQLCGMHAQEASRQDPQRYLQQDALNPESRVIITGILSNPVAFHLALTLKAHCGVEVMVGIDPMLPNTISNRLKLVEQMKILTSNAPKMVQPILVPLLGLDPRLKRSKVENSVQPQMLQITGELNLLSFKPTHIVHLSTAMPERYPEEKAPPETAYAPKRPLSPYQISEDDKYEPYLFPIRSSMAAMEQILSSIATSSEDGGSVPHLTYASTTMTNQYTISNEDKIHATTKFADEVLADTYHSLFGVNSIGVRMPPNAIYGPWDQPGSDLSQMMTSALQGNFTASQKYASAQELLYVQDAVEAIIAAMQFRPKKATAFDLSSGSMASRLEVSSVVRTALTTTESIPATTGKAMVLTQQDSRAAHFLGWHAQTSVRNGILRTLAWHMERAHPYGESLTRKEKQLPAAIPGTGDSLLLRNSISTCAEDDLACHSGSSYLPCISECSTKTQCKASIFDPVRQLSRNMTEGCDAVLYTKSLGLNVEDLKLQAEFEDEVEPVICNLAFAARGSPLVRAVIEKIPPKELVRLGVSDSADFEDKLIRLNGRLLYRGWILIWVEPGDSVSHEDSALLKLSPGRLFSADVLYAVFIEENFSVSPTTDDVRFLISQLDRGSMKKRSIYRWIKAVESNKPKNVKFTIPEAPAKRASILLSQLKYKISEKTRIPQETKISVMDAVRFMRFEIGNDPTRQRESGNIKRQKEFYRRVPSFVNSKDLRDNFAPLYKYELKHWVRTRWVVHDLRLEESRQLRCDWYQEYVQWGSTIDQLSFAAVMAKREVERRIALGEPDDRAKSKDSEIPAEVKDVTDFDEWHAMEMEQNKLQTAEIVQSAKVEQVPDYMVRDGVDEGGTEEEADTLPNQPAEKRPETGIYVRIISDRIMSLSRKAWVKYKAAEPAG